MNDDSPFTLRWEVDAATVALGRAESDVYVGGGFKWTIAAEFRPDESRDPINGTADFALICDDTLGPNRLWKCEAEVDMYMTKIKGKRLQFCNKERFTVDKAAPSWLYQTSLYWSMMMHPIYTIDGKVILEFGINILSSESEEIADPDKFAAPNNRSDVILLIGDKKLHVSKELMAINSPIFQAMFFGSFVEKGKEEIEIKDVVYEEFLDLLHLIYPGSMRITDRSVLHILALADRFQIEHLLDQSKKHLLITKAVDVVTKLLYADHYNIVELRDSCLNSFDSPTELATQLKSSHEFNNFSAAMKVAICERIMQLTPEV